MAGCSGNESGTDPQQENNSASSAESMTIQANESTNETAVSEAADPASEENSPVVYFTSDISAEGLVKIYDTLGWTPEGKVAVKISTGEPPASNYLRPELIGDLFRKWMARLWNAIPHTADHVPIQQCIDRLRKIMALRRSQTLI